MKKNLMMGFFIVLFILISIKTIDAQVSASDFNLDLSNPTQRFVGSWTNVHNTREIWQFDTNGAGSVGNSSLRYIISEIIVISRSSHSNAEAYHYSFLLNGRTLILISVNGNNVLWLTKNN